MLEPSSPVIGPALAEPSASERSSNVPFLVFGAPQILEEDIQEVVAVLRSGWIGTGPRTSQFEEQFRTYRRASQAIAVNSGTAALHLSMIAANLQPGDEVITTPMTFCATVNAVLHSEATPVLADINSRTLNLDPWQVEQRITPRTRAIVPVHFAGRPCEMAPLVALAQKHNLFLIEDCAHAIEAEYHGRAVGTIGDFGCFSFYATKNLTTGEGGMVLTSDVDHAERIRCLATHGLNAGAWNRFGGNGFRHYEVLECGFKYNLTDMQAALGIHQLRRCETNWRRRSEIWRTYDSELANVPLTLPVGPAANTRHALHLYTVLVDVAVTGISRDEFLSRMTSQGVGGGVHYLSLPQHDFYQRRLGWRPEDYPVSHRIGQQIVSLPISPHMKDADVQRVLSAVRQALRC